MELADQEEFGRHMLLATLIMPLISDSIKLASAPKIYLTDTMASPSVA